MKSFSILVLLVLTAVYTHAQPTQEVQLSAVTKNTQTTYFIYHNKSRCCKQAYYCRGGYLAFPCQKRCLINRQGEVIRCVTHCC